MCTFIPHCRQDAGTALSKTSGHTSITQALADISAGRGGALRAAMMMMTVHTLPLWHGGGALTGEQLRAYGGRSHATMLYRRGRASRVVLVQTRRADGELAPQSVSNTTPPHPHTTTQPNPHPANEAVEPARISRRVGKLLQLTRVVRLRRVSDESPLCKMLRLICF